MKILHSILNWDLYRKSIQILVTVVSETLQHPICPIQWCHVKFCDRPWHTVTRKAFKWNTDEILSPYSLEVWYIKRDKPLLRDCGISRCLRNMNLIQNPFQILIVSIINNLSSVWRNYLLIVKCEILGTNWLNNAFK